MTRLPARRLLLAITCSLAVVFGALPLPHPSLAQQQPLNYVDGEVVALIPGPGQRILQRVARQYNLSSRPLDEFGRRQIYRLKILDGMPPPEKAAQLRRDPRVKLAEPNYVSGFPEDSGRRRWKVGESSSAPPSLWGMEQIDLAAAPGRGKGVVVAVLDTGVDIQHPRLKNRLIRGYDFVDNDTNPSERKGRDADAYGHGTHVVGIVSMLAPEAKIMPVRVLDSEGFGNMWVLGEALLFAADPNGDGNVADGADVINLSLVAGRDSRVLDSLIEDSTVCYDHDDNTRTSDSCVQRKGLRSMGVIVVAAAGNDDDGDPSTPAPIVYPAAQAGVIGVAATDQADLKASFSNHSADYVDIAAPGVGITSLAPNKRYATWDGTSMAAPFVAGAAAAIWSSNLRLTSSDVIARLRSQATAIDSLNPGFGGQLGVGRLDFTPAQASFVPLTLTSICTVDAAQGLARWRVLNTNPFSVTYIWELYGAEQQGQRTVGPSSEDLFAGPVGTLVVKSSGLQTAKATNPTLCPQPTPTQAPTSTPTDMPEEALTETDEVTGTATITPTETVVVTPTVALTETGAVTDTGLP